VLSRMPEEFTVFIDNLNSCTDEALGLMLNALVFRTPASVRFVWSSTSEIPLVDESKCRTAWCQRPIGESLSGVRLLLFLSAQ